MLRTVIYSRKSLEDDDRQVQSIVSQENELRPIAATRNLAVRKEFGEAQSAKKPGRPKFNEMMSMINRREIDVILCWKLDRLARNPIDGAAIIWAMKIHGLVVMTPQQTFSQAEDNQILMYIEFGMAQKYIDDLGRNTKRGLKTKAERGWYPGLAPIGYLNSKIEERGHKTVLVDPDRFQAVRRMWDLMLSGNYRPTEIVKIANTQWGFRTRQTKRTGGKPLCRSAIYKIFSDPFYSGRYEYPKGSGDWHDGKHKPMVTPAEFEAVRKLLSQTASSRPFEDAQLSFTGLIRCGNCGSAVTAEIKIQVRCTRCRYKSSVKNRQACSRCDLAVSKMDRPKLRHYTYYHCTRTLNPACREKCVSDASLGKQVRNQIMNFGLSQELKEWGLDFIHKLRSEEQDQRDQVLREKRKMLAQCSARLENLLKLKTSPENINGALISDEEYQAQRATLLKERDSFADQGRQFEANLEKKVRVTSQVLEFVAAIGTSESAQTARAREVLRALGSNHILLNKNLVVKPDFPFSELPPANEPDSEELRPIEPENTEGKQRFFGHFRHERPFLVPRPRIELGTYPSSGERSTN